jgi:hypothetical protein
LSVCFTAINGETGSDCVGSRPIAVSYTALRGEKGFGNRWINPG